MLTKFFNFQDGREGINILRCLYVPVLDEEGECALVCAPLRSCAVSAAIASRCLATICHTWKMCALETGQATIITITMIRFIQWI